MESLGIVCVLSIHSTIIQFSNLKSCAHPHHFFAFLIHGLGQGRSYRNRPVWPSFAETREQLTRQCYAHLAGFPSAGVISLVNEVFL